MKKLICLSTAMLIAMPAFGAGVVVDSNPLKGETPIRDGRIYAPLSEVSSLFENPVDVIEIDGEAYVPLRKNCDENSLGIMWLGDTAEVSTKFADAFDGRLFVVTVDGKALRVEADSKDNSARLCVGESSQTDFAVWSLSSKGGNAFGFINKASGKAVDLPASSKEIGKGVTQYSANSGANQTLIMENKGEGKFALKFKHSDLYLTLGEDGFFTQEEFIGDEKQLFSFDYVGDGAMKKVKESEGYKLLDEETRERFDTYVYTTLAYTSSINSQAAALIEGENYNEKTPEEQKEILEKCLTFTAFNLVYIGEVPPESDNIEVEITNKTFIESYDVWRGTMESVWRYDVNMSDGYSMQLYTTVEDCSVVNDAANALSRFPLAMRKYLARLIHRMDDANNYNGGGDTIWIRLNYLPSENAIAQTLAHELGHVLDSRLTTDSSVWADAIKADRVPVSGYGNNNQTEDLAEFSRLYHMAKRSDDIMEALGKVYPNRMKAYQALLYAGDSEYYADFKYAYEELSPFVKGQEEVYGTLCIDKSDLVLTATANSGEALTFEKNTQSDLQLWQIRRRKDGAAVLFNKETGYCVNVPGNSTDEGKQLISWNGSGNANETWDITENDDGTFSFKVRHSGLFLGEANGVPVQTEVCASWSFTPVK